MNPTEPDPLTPGQPADTNQQQPPPQPTPHEGGAADVGDAVGAAADGLDLAGDAVSGAADAAGSVLEGAGGCLDGCGGCSLAVLLTLITAGTAVAAWLG